MLADLHLHSRYSADSEEIMEAHVQRALEMKLPVICFTDHIDWDFPIEELVFDYDMDAYLSEIEQLQDRYGKKIRILRGVELGMQPQLGERYHELLQKHDFDFAIGSQHLVNRMDPYYPETFEGRSDKEVFQQYFEETLENLQNFDEMSTLGHLDYVIRYGKNGARDYSYKENREVIDEILRILIRRDIALEVNSAGLRKNLGFPHPHPEILHRYRELGGKLITTGSDAHVYQDLGKDLNRVEQLLESVGFKETCYFVNRSPVFMKIG